MIRLTEEYREKYNGYMTSTPTELMVVCLKNELIELLRKTANLPNRKSLRELIIEHIEKLIVGDLYRVDSQTGSKLRDKLDALKRSGTTPELEALLLEVIQASRRRFHNKRREHCSKIK